MFLWGQVLNNLACYVLQITDDMGLKNLELASSIRPSFTSLTVAGSYRAPTLIGTLQMKEMDLPYIVTATVTGPQPNVQDHTHTFPKVLNGENSPSLVNKKSYPTSTKHGEETIMSKIKCETSSRPSPIASQTVFSAVPPRDPNPIVEENRSIQNVQRALSSISIAESSTKGLHQDTCNFQDPVAHNNIDCIYKISKSKDDSSADNFPLFANVQDCWTDSNGMIQDSSCSIRANGRDLPYLIFDQSVYASNNSFLSILNSFPPIPPVSSSRKKLLVLDINGILADIVYPPPKGYSADVKIAGRAVFRRPFCYDFLNFCLQRFNVAIWSSRSKRIVDQVVHYLMGDLKHRLSFCWDISYCTESKFRTLENRHKTLVFKDLRTLWEFSDPNLPWEKGDYDESNTFLLDDSPYKALLNPPHTGIFPYPFHFSDQADSAIGPSGNLQAYLERLAMAENVQEYIEQNPFGQSAITERSLSWRFYSKVLEEQYAMAS